jgi:CHRD domain
VKRFATIATVASVVLAGTAATVQSGGAATAHSVAAPSKVTICHKTGSDQFRRITVSSRAVTNPKSKSGKVLRGHMGHVGDLVVAGAAACPSPNLTPAPTSTPPTKMTICHKTGSASNPYRRITVSSRALTNPNSKSGKVLRGHMGHTGDIVAAGTATCPSGSAQQNPGGKLTSTLQPVQGATGSGNASFTIGVGQTRLCYTLTVSGLTNVTAAHIHRVSTGAIVVPLTAPTSGTSSGCITVERALLREIMRNPGAFFVNVHTATYPNGQVQGPLSR